MSATISKQLFEAHQEDLVHLGAAIENIRKQIYQLSDDLPEELSEKFGELASICHCLTGLANQYSERAEDWAKQAA